MFASRFDNSGDANQGKWIFAGQSRGNGGSGPDVPSLNIKHQPGVDQLNLNLSLNVDVNRAGIEPDIAFTGANDSVPWVLWYETGAGGLAQNDLVFAAKAESDTGPGVY